MNKRRGLLISSSIALLLLGACNKGGNNSVASNNNSQENSSIVETSSNIENSSNGLTSSAANSSSVASSSKEDKSSSNTSKNSSNSTVNNTSVTSSVVPVVKYKAILLDDAYCTLTLKSSLDMNAITAGEKVAVKVTTTNSEVIVKNIIVTGEDSSLEVVTRLNGEYFEFIMPAENVEIRADYDLKRYEVNAFEPEQNHFSMMKIGVFDTFAAGETAGFCVNADYGYKLVSFSAKTASGVEVVLDNRGNGTAYFVMPAEDVYVYAVTEQKYQISTVASEHTSITLGSNAEYFEVGQTVTFTVSVNSVYYLFDKVTVEYEDNGANKPVEFVENGGTYSFAMPKGNVTISTFEKAVDMSGDPFAGNPLTFEGDYDYNGYDLYHMHLRIQFTGDSKLNYWLTWTMDDSWGDDYWTNDGQTISGPTKNNMYLDEEGMTQATSIPSDMEGTKRDGYLKCSYLYNPVTNEIEATVGYNRSTSVLKLSVQKDSAGQIVSVTCLNNIYTEYYACNGAVLSKI